MAVWELDTERRKMAFSSFFSDHRREECVFLSYLSLYSPLLLPSIPAHLVPRVPHSSLWILAVICHPLFITLQNDQILFSLSKTSLLGIKAI